MTLGLKAMKPCDVFGKLMALAINRIKPIQASGTHLFLRKLLFRAKTEKGHPGLATNTQHRAMFLCKSQETDPKQKQKEVLQAKTNLEGKSKAGHEQPARAGWREAKSNKSKPRISKAGPTPLSFEGSTPWVGRGNQKTKKQKSKMGCKPDR